VKDVTAHHDILQRTAESLLGLQEKRNVLSWKEAYAARVQELASLHKEDLEAERSLAEALAERSVRGWDLVDIFARWVRIFYADIDVRAEGNFVAFQRELPRDAEKCRQLLDICESDLQSRRQTTQKAMQLTHVKLAQLEAELERLQHARRADE